MKKLNFNENINIYQFNHELKNSEEIKENLKKSMIYSALVDFCNGNQEPLKNYIENHHFGDDEIRSFGRVKLQGFIIDFKKLLKKYLVQDQCFGYYIPYYSVNKTTLRRSLYNTKSKILNYID